jgi:hypothetical protein
MSRTLFGSMMTMAAVLALGCGGNGPVDGVDGAPNVDCAPSASERYLPFAVGNLWQFRVTDPTGVKPQSNKRQEFSEEFVPEGDTEPAMLQVTTKPNGRTESWLRLQGDAVVRLQQQDFDATGLLERTTVYDPFNPRLDESAEHTALGATWQVTYTDIVLDPQGVELSRAEVIDEWTVMGVDVPCSVPWGTLQCLHVHRERLEGGFTIKDYYFARGYGKIREEGSGQNEELIGCALQ